MTTEHTRYRERPKVRMMFRIELAFAIAVVTLPPAASAAEPISAAAQMLQRLHSEAVVEWRAMAQKLEHSNFDYTIVESNRTGRTALKRKKQVSGRVAGDCFLVTETIESTDQVSVYGRNERYEFALTRTGDAPWMVTWQSARGNANTPVGSAYAYLEGMLQFPWCISATPLEKLVNNPRFSIREVQPGDKGAVRIAFVVTPADSRPDDLQGLSSGSIVLDPAQRWAIQRYDAKYSNKMSSSLELTYGASGPPELRHVEFALSVSTGNTSTFSLNAGHYDWNPVQNSDFSLPAFGLPDYREPSSTRRLLLVNIGLICVLVGVILYRRRRHLRARA